MQARPRWHYDECRHCGVDYNRAEQVAVYDQRHQRLRDYGKQSAGILAALGLGRGMSVLDMGAGTGAFALHAAEVCEKVYAVDVSPAMLDYAQQQARERGLSNIEFIRGGFLTYEHAALPVDASVSVAALHHLPDFWKQVALARLATMLRPGGKFYLLDVVFPAAPERVLPGIDAWIAGIERAAGPEFAAEAETHVRDEHSTYDWVMEGLLQRAGFRIEKAKYEGFLGEYVCVRG